MWRATESPATGRACEHRTEWPSGRIAPSTSRTWATLRVLRIATDGSRTKIEGFEQPRNVAVDKNGVLYVSDFGANRVYRVRSNGSLESVTNETLKGPAALAFDPSGTLYIADSGNQRVIAIKDGKVRTALKDFGAVTSIAIDLGGRLFAAGGDRVAVVSPTGDITILKTPADEVALDVYGSLITVTNRQIRSYRLGATTTLAGEVSPSPETDVLARSGDSSVPPPPSATQLGSVYISDTGNGRIRRIDPAGKLATIMTMLEGPAYLALNRLDELYLSDSKAGMIYRIGQDGKSEVFSKGSATQPLLRPSGLAFDAANQLYVADSGNGLIRRIAPDGFVSTIAGGGTSFSDGFATSIALKNPTGIAVDKEGTVWFTETGRLRRMRADGRVTTVPGIPLVDPRGIHVDDHDRLIVADAGANQIFRVTRTVNGKHDRRIRRNPKRSDRCVARVRRIDSCLRQRQQSHPSTEATRSCADRDAPVETGTSVENGDGSLNSPARPATRTGTVKLRVPAPAGTASPYVVAEIASIEIPPVSVDYSNGQYTIVLQLPGGFLPSGTTPLSLWINAKEVERPINVSIR